MRRTRDGGVCGFQEERSLRRLWRLGGRVQNRRWAAPETESGMHWTVRGANSIVALRCSIMKQPLGRFLGASGGGGVKIYY